MTLSYSFYVNFLTMSAFQFEHFRQHFPLLNKPVNNQPLVYFDNAATTQKMSSTISQVTNYYQEYNANVHRASHQLSAKATFAFEQTREKVRSFINAQLLEEVIWTKGTTESINLVANSWGLTNLVEGDEVILSQAEHHANIVPWQLVAEKTGAVIKVLPLTATGVIDLTALSSLLSNKTRLVSISHISNVVGKLNNIKEIAKLVKANNALLCIDGAQAIAHEPVDVQQIDCDFYVFSAHKIYGPTGLGVLYGKKTLLDKMPPYQAGGEMIKNVSFNHTSFNHLPFKFEAGTPNISAVVAFGNALENFLEYDFQAIKNYENFLAQYGYKQLQTVPDLTFILEQQPDIPIFSFYIKGIHNHDLAAALDARGIAVRSGHHCAMPLMEYLGLNGCVRASLGAYNSTDEIDTFIHVLKEIQSNDKVISQPQLNTVEELPFQSNTKPENYNNNSLIDEIITLFDKAKSWDAKHREIMLLGKQLQRLPKEQRSDDLLIDGCESKAWLSGNLQTDGRLFFSADSDAKIIRGLLFIVLAAFQNLTAKEALCFNVEQYFERLGLLHHLSPSRGSGLKAIVSRIIAIAQST